MLARVVFPLHGFGGIERHVFHLTTHLARLGVRVTLYVQTPGAPSHNHTPDRANPYADALPGIERVITLRYDYTSPLLRPNSISGRQINYPWYSWRLGRMAAIAARRGAYDVVHAQGLCAFGYGWIRVRDPLLRRLPFIATRMGWKSTAHPIGANGWHMRPFERSTPTAHVVPTVPSQPMPVHGTTCHAIWASIRSGLWLFPAPSTPTNAWRRSTTPCARSCANGCTSMTPI